MSQILSWLENYNTITKKWLSESHLSSPKTIKIASDELKADVFYKTASEGCGYIWRGDFQNAKQLLQAVQRRIDKQQKATQFKVLTKTVTKPIDLFHRYRQAQAHRAQLLSRLLIYVEPDLTIQLRRAPDVKQALREALQITHGDFLISLRELLGIIGAHEWRKKGVFVTALGDHIHPHYGLFSPVRSEYLDLVSSAPISNNIKVAFDIGTGTGVIAAILAKRGIEKIVATDNELRAIASAKENIERLGFAKQVQIIESHLYPNQKNCNITKADLIVCNPPWLPVRPTTKIEHALYDENSQMLKAFLAGVNDHLNEQGEAWLIMSDLAEHLGLRENTFLTNLINDSQLEVIEALSVHAAHKKVEDFEDPLHFARTKEKTNLFRLKKASP